MPDAATLQALCKDRVLPGTAAALGRHYHREPWEKQSRIPERDLHGTACTETAVSLPAWGCPHR